jgi:hypothetical protein
MLGFMVDSEGKTSISHDELTAHASQLMYPAFPFLPLLCVVPLLTPPQIALVVRKQ